MSFNINSMNNSNETYQFKAVMHTKGTGFDLYKSGIFFDSKCSNNASYLDHAIVSKYRNFIINE